MFQMIYPSITVLSSAVLSDQLGTCIHLRPSFPLKQRPARLGCCQAVVVINMKRPTGDNGDLVPTNYLQVNLTPTYMCKLDEEIWSVHGHCRCGKVFLPFLMQTTRNDPEAFELSHGVTHQTYNKSVGATHLHAMHWILSLPPCKGSWRM